MNVGEEVKGSKDEQALVPWDVWGWGGEGVGPGGLCPCRKQGDGMGSIECQP